MAVSPPTGVSPESDPDPGSLGRNKPRPPVMPKLQFEWWMVEATLKSITMTAIERDVTHFFFVCEGEIVGPCGEKSTICYSGNLDDVKAIRSVSSDACDLTTRRLYRIGLLDGLGP